jgi:hypothetical protein
MPLLLTKLQTRALTTPLSPQLSPLQLIEVALGMRFEFDNFMTLFSHSLHLSLLSFL